MPNYDDEDDEKYYRYYGGDAGGDGCIVTIVVIIAILFGCWYGMKHFDQASHQQDQQEQVEANKEYQHDDALSHDPARMSRNVSHMCQKIGYNATDQTNIVNQFNNISNKQKWGVYQNIDDAYAEFQRDGGDDQMEANNEITKALHPNQPHHGLGE